MTYDVLILDRKLGGCQQSRIAPVNPGGTRQLCPEQNPELEIEVVCRTCGLCRFRLCTECFTGLMEYEPEFQREPEDDKFLGTRRDAVPVEEWQIEMLVFCGVVEQRHEVVALMGAEPL